jgi:hypothetical protein
VVEADRHYPAQARPVAGQELLSGGAIAAGGAFNQLLGMGGVAAIVERPSLYPTSGNRCGWGQDSGRFPEDSAQRGPDT